MFTQQRKAARSGNLEVSVLFPFGDDEETVGTACSRLAHHLRELGLSFELLAVDEDSGDNSHAVLGLMRGSLPELSIVYADGRDRGFATGAKEARGRAVLLIDAEAAKMPLAPLARAIRRVLGDEADAVFVRGRLAVCHRTRTLAALSSIRGRNLGPLRKRLGQGECRLEVVGAPAGKSRSSRPFARLLSAFALPRS